MSVSRVEGGLATRPIEDDEDRTREPKGGADPTEAMVRGGINMGKAAIHARTR